MAFFVNLSIYNNLKKEQEIKLESVHNEAVDKVKNALNNFASLIASMKAFVENRGEFPDEPALKKFIFDVLKQIEYNDSLVISYVDTNHVFRYSFTRTQSDPAKLVGSSVTNLRDTAHINRLNRAMNDSVLHLYHPMNLREGWPGLPAVFGVYESGKPIGYIAPILDFRTLISQVYQNSETVDKFAFKFKVLDGAEFDRTTVFDKRKTYTTEVDEENYKNFNIQEDQFLYTTIEKYGLKIEIGTAYKKTPKKYIKVSLIIWGSYLIFSFLMALIAINIYKTRQLNIFLKRNNYKITEQKVELEAQRDKVIIQNQIQNDTYKKLKAVEKNIRNRNQQLKLLNEIDRKIIVSLDSKTIIETVYEHINQLMEAQGFGIGVYNPDKNVIGFDSFIQNKKALKYKEVSMDNSSSLTVWCFNNQEDIIINNYSEQASFYVNEIYNIEDGENPNSMIYTPLSTSKKIGVMTIQSFKKEAYSDYHIGILRNIAVFASIALDNAEVYKSIEKQKEAISKQSEKLSTFVEELKVANEVAEKNNKELTRLSLAVSRTDNAVMITGNTGDIEWVNPAFTKLYGFTLEEFTALYRNIFECNTNNYINEFILTAIEYKQTVRYEAELSKKDGSTIWVQTTWTPVLDENEELINLIAVDSNITDLKEAENEIKIQQKSITDSIHYARYIQQAILPSQKSIASMFENFVLFKPKDIVSGDFYFAQKVGKIHYFAVADCTGHGVPGAFITMLGMSILENIEKTKAPGEALDLLRKRIKQIFKDPQYKDGMDIALCSYNSETQELSYAGAYNPLVLIRDNKLTEYRATRNPIGHYYREISFETQVIKIKKGDTIYLFTDGFTDQFGGERNKKFQKKRLKIHF